MAIRLSAFPAVHSTLPALAAAVALAYLAYSVMSTPEPLAQCSIPDTSVAPSAHVAEVPVYQLAPIEITASRNARGHEHEAAAPSVAPRTASSASRKAA